MALFQPCPAPPLIAVAAEAGADAAAAAASDAVLSDTAAGGSALAAGTGRRRRGTSTSSSAIGDCMFEGAQAGHHLDLSQLSKGHVVVEGLPSSRIDQTTAWNSHPRIQQLENKYGKVTVVNGTAVILDGLPASTINIFEGIIAKTGSSRRV